MVSGASPARYLRVECTFIRATEKAVHFRQERDDIAEGFWVPRTLLHGADDNMITRDLQDKKLNVGDQIELRIEAWVCEREGIEGVQYSVYDKR